MSFVDKFALRKRSEIDDYQSYNLGFSSLCVGTENKFCFKSEYLVPSRKVVIEEENQISEVYRGGKISYWNAILNSTAFLNLIGRQLIFQDTEFQEIDCETNSGLLFNLKKENDNLNFSLFNNTITLKDSQPAFGSRFLNLNFTSTSSNATIANFLSFEEQEMNIGSYKLTLSDSAFSFPPSFNLDSIGQVDGITNCYKQTNSTGFFPSFSSQKLTSIFEDNTWETRSYESIPSFFYNGTMIDLSSWPTSGYYSRSFILNCIENFPANGIKKICKFPIHLQTSTYFVSCENFNNMIQPMLTNLYQESEGEGNDDSYYIKCLFQPGANLPIGESIYGAESYFLSIFINVTFKDSKLIISGSVQDVSLIDDCFF